MQVGHVDYEAEKRKRDAKKKHAILTSSNEKEAWGYFQPQVRDYVWNKTLRDQMLNSIFKKKKKNEVKYA